MPDLKVKVRSGGATGASDLRDLRTFHHHIADVREPRRTMRVPRYQTAAVIDLDHITILRMEL